MKRLITIVGIVLIALIIFYSLFIIEESIRLKEDGEYPLIILDGGYCNKKGKIKKTTYGYETDCKGLGYNIIREYTSKEKDSDIYYIIREEFWLFDKFLLWGWVS